MYFIKIQDPINNLGLVTFIHYMPELLSEQDKANGILVESFDQPAQVEGKIVQTYYDTINKEIVFKYIDRPKTEAEKQQDLLDQMIIDNLNMQSQIDNLIAAKQS